MQWVRSYGPNVFWQLNDSKYRPHQNTRQKEYKLAGREWEDFNQQAYASSKCVVIFRHRQDQGGRVQGGFCPTKNDMLTFLTKPLQWAFFCKKERKILNLNIHRSVLEYRKCY